MKMFLITAIVLTAIFVGGLLTGLSVSRRPDPVTNGMIQEKIEHETSEIMSRLDGVDSKLDILLNMATNQVSPDIRR